MTQSQDRIAAERSHLKQMPQKTIDRLCDSVLSILGAAGNSLEKETVDCYKKGDYDRVKFLCLQDPCNPYLAVLSCLASAQRSPTIAESTLRDAARWCTESARARTDRALAQAFSNILKDD